MQRHHAPAQWCCRGTSRQTLPHIRGLATRHCIPSPQGGSCAAAAPAPLPLSKPHCPVPAMMATCTSTPTHARQSRGRSLSATSCAVASHATRPPAGLGASTARAGSVPAPQVSAALVCAVGLLARKWWPARPPLLPACLPSACPREGIWAACHRGQDRRPPHAGRGTRSRATAGACPPSAPARPAFLTVPHAPVSARQPSRVMWPCLLPPLPPGCVSGGLAARPGVAGVASASPRKRVVPPSCGSPRLCARACRERADVPRAVPCRAVPAALLLRTPSSSRGGGWVVVGASAVCLWVYDCARRHTTHPRPHPRRTHARDTHGVEVAYPTKHGYVCGGVVPHIRGTHTRDTQEAPQQAGVRHLHA